jgi:HlyD family secretion protein
MSRVPSARSLRTAAKLLLPAGVVAFVVFRFLTASVLVEAQPVARALVVAEVMGTGTLDARVKTTLSPRLQERLAEVLVDEGEFVQAGQLLARLDDAELKQLVAIAEASVAAAQASIERVRADEARARAVAQQARLNHQRTIDLLATKIASQADLDKALEQLQVAEADLKRAQAAITEAERQATTTEKTLLQQRERLGYARLTSPYDGLIVKRERDAGGVVVPGSAILEVVSTNEIWVSAWVDETAMSALAPGQAARVVFRSEPAKPYAGAVARLGRETDRETREALVDVRVRELPANWTIGQRAEVFIETGRQPDALAVPAAFVQWRGGQPGVFVRDAGRARWRGVTLGLRGRERVEITQGLGVGDEVVKPANPKQELADGQRVSVTTPNPGKPGGGK